MDERISECESRPDASDDNKGDDASFHWSVHPLRENAVKSFFLIIILVLLFTAVYWGTDGDIFLTGVSVLIMTGTLSPYFFVTRYEMDAKGVRQKRGQMVNRKRWTDFRRYYVGKTHITLSPFDYATRLESFRSMTLLFDPRNRDRIEAFVRSHMTRDDDECETPAASDDQERGGGPLDQSKKPVEDNEA